jgi:hypothetical protein
MVYPDYAQRVKLLGPEGGASEKPMELSLNAEVELDAIFEKTRTQGWASLSDEERRKAVDWELNRLH